MRPETYRNNLGCSDCKHVFVYYEYDEGETLYCQQDGVTRPPCMSVLMKECVGFYDDDQDLYKASNKEWREWEADRKVAESGICDEFERSGDD